MTVPDGSPHHGPAGPRIDHEIPARQPWSGIIRAGERLRLVDTHGQQAIDTLFYNAHDYSDRYSAQRPFLKWPLRVEKPRTRTLLTLNAKGNRR